MNPPNIFLVSRRTLYAFLLSRKIVNKGARDQGYALQVALLIFLLLSIGVAAFASRSTGGLFGAIGQSVNRESRDVAESVIQEFATTLNIERNRRLLIAGNAITWDATNADLTNPCAGYTNSEPPTKLTSSVGPDSVAIERFKESGAASTPKYLDKTGTDTSRQFIVEKIEYLAPDINNNNNRIAFSSGVSSSGSFPFTEVRDGALRSLIRITVIGIVDRNGSKSRARVSREFEIVPKCCKRSFGNQSANENWGRDSGTCTVKSPTSAGGNGIIGMLNGGVVTGGGSLDVKNELGDTITQATCWAGNEPGISSVLTGDTDNCTETDPRPSIGKGAGITFVPDEFSLSAGLFQFDSKTPTDTDYVNAAEASYTGSNYYMYIDTGSSPKTVKICSYNLTANTLSSCENLSPKCYVGSTNSPPLTPYYEAYCRFRNFKTANTTTVYFDTSGGRLNIYFDNTVTTASPLVVSNYTGEYLGSTSSGGAGKATFVRTHCTPDWTTSLAPNTSGYQDSSIKPCNKTIMWDSPSTSTKTSFQELCSYKGTLCPDHNVSELLNIFTLGNGTFTLKGGAGVLGFNLVAPNATVTFVGGGNPKIIDFMGRVWADDIKLSGNVNIRTFSGNPAFCSGASCPDGGNLSLFDYMARSFSQSSGFGLSF